MCIRLVNLLEDIMDGSRILIFMDTKKGCDQITRQLRMDGWPALSIHGDKSQAERDWVLSEFKSGKSPIMTATDVAARGLGMLNLLDILPPSSNISLLHVAPACIGSDHFGSYIRSLSLHFCKRLVLGLDLMVTRQQLYFCAGQCCRTCQ
jgi:hypothetical protein